MQRINCRLRIRKLTEASTFQVQVEKKERGGIFRWEKEMNVCSFHLGMISNSVIPPELLDSWCLNRADISCLRTS
jgi:hypothetical protein